MHQLSRIHIVLAIYFISSVTSNAQVTTTRSIGEKYFEISNHLGNVTAIVNDRHASIQGGYVDSVAYHESNILQSNLYYPYGSLLGTSNANKNFIYRFGFQGQEQDNEIKGSGNAINYSYRMHDTRLGRFFTLDPLTSKYPHYSSYQFSGNKPIAFVEFMGLEERPKTNESENHDENCDCIIQENRPAETEINGRVVLRWKYKPKVTYQKERMSIFNRLANVFRHPSRRKGNVKKIIEHRWFPQYKPIIKPKERKSIGNNRNPEDWLPTEPFYTFGIFSLESKDGLLVSQEIGTNDSGLMGKTINATNEPLQFNSTGDIINSTGQILHQRPKGLEPGHLIIPIEYFDMAENIDMANRRFAPGQMKPINNGAQVYEQRHDGLYYNITQKIIDGN